MQGELVGCGKHPKSEQLTLVWCDIRDIIFSKSLGLLSSRWQPTALLIQALITFPVLRTKTLISDINIKPQSARFCFFLLTKPHNKIHSLVSQQPAKHPAWMVFTESQFFYLPFHKRDHSSRFTSSHWRKHPQWHDAVSTVKVVTCKDPPSQESAGCCTKTDDMVDV